MKISKDKAAEAVQGIEGEEVHVLSVKEHDDLLENFKKTTVEAELKTRIGQIYYDLDRDFAEKTGLKKPDDVKTYKYWPDIVKQFKDKADQAAAELDNVKKSGNPELAKEIETLRKLAQEKDAEWKQRYDALQAESVKKDIKNVLDGSTRGLKFADMPQAVLDTFIENAKSKVTATAKFVENELVFCDANGNPMINKETYKPYTAAELMKMELEPIIAKGDNNKGAGSQQPKVAKDKDGKVDVTMTIPTNVGSKLELTKFLIESGMPLNSPEFNAAYDKYGKDLPIGK